MAIVLIFLFLIAFMIFGVSSYQENIPKCIVTLMLMLAVAILCTILGVMMEKQQPKPPCERCCKLF